MPKIKGGNLEMKHQFNQRKVFWGMLFLVGLLTIGQARVSFGAGSITYSSATLTPTQYPSGIVSYWKFEEGTGSVAHDSISGNHGTIYGANWSTGQVGDALTFDGLDDMIVVPHSPSLSLEEFTIEAWVKQYSNPAAAGGSEGCILVKRYTGSWMDNYAMWIDRDAAAWSSFYSMDIPGWDSVSSIGKISFDRWYYIAATYDRTVLKIYINGELDNSKNMKYMPFLNNLCPLVIGRATAGCPCEFKPSNPSIKGIIDEVAIYNKALTPEEIQQHYRNGLHGLGYEIVVISVGTITGKVTESNGKTPIEKVLVEALQGTVTIGSTTTDANGSYAIALAKGSYTVRVSKQQYLSTQTTDIVVSQDTTTCLDFILYSARIKPIVSSPQSAGSEVLLKIQVGDEQEPVEDLFTIFGTLTWTSANDIEILNITPGDFIGNDLQIFDIVKSEGKVQFMMRRKTGTGGATGYGSVLDIKLKISNQAQLGTITFSLDGLEAYNSTVQWISLLPESKEMRVNEVAIKPIVYPSILPGQEFIMDIQVGDIDNPVTGLKSLSFDAKWEGLETVAIEWKPWTAPYWGMIEPPCPDAVYADANGDGVVDLIDVHAIIQNYGKTHPKTLALSTPTMKTDNTLIDAYRQVLRNRPDLLENVKNVLASLENSPEIQQESQEFIKVLREIIEPLPLTEFKVYPNPYRPTTTHSGITGVTFANLGSNWHIRVFNLAGELVKEIEGNQDSYTWNEAKDLASGLYIYTIHSSTLSNKKGKIAIIK